MLELCQPPDPNPRTPCLRVPPGATDSHIHIYGPESQFPTAPTAKFAVPEALPASYCHLREVLGIQRVVAVQPSGYGTDNRRQLTALKELGIPGRAVVTVPLDISDSELTQLHEQGARGVRFAIGRKKSVAIEEIARFAERLVPLNWHIEFHVVREDDTQAFGRAKAVLSSFPVEVVFAHFLELEAYAGVGHPDFKILCDLMYGGRCWAKLSAGYRISHEPPYRDVTAFAQALVSIRPDRLVWGSDWPNVNYKGKMPNTTDLLDCLLEWVPDETMRHRILVDNPAVLYGF